MRLRRFWGDGQADAADYGYTVEHKGGVLDVRNDLVSRTHRRPLRRPK
ncbi:hypothetical protein [Dactylosporangium sp. NPDC000521]